MSKTVEMQIIARIENDFVDKFGIPRQSGLTPEMESMIIFQPEYRNADALRGIEGFSHLWLIWQFSKSVRSQWSPTVRPPRLGGNTRVGVFATRSPFRPNSMGLSSVKLERVEHSEKYGAVLIVSGADLLSGTPIFDIKPYIAYTDSHPDALCGFTDNVEYGMVKVNCSQNLLEKVVPEKRSSLINVLENDPRPPYHNDEQRVYKMSFGNLTVLFTVAGDELTVTDIV